MLQPVHERILVKPDEVETETTGGILIPNESQKRPQLGIVIACGEGLPHNPMVVKKGDRILYNRYAGQELIVNGEDLVIIMINEVLTKLDKGDVIEFSH